MKKLIKLRRLRLEYGYTGEEVAKLVGISKSYYFQLEYGHKRLYYETAIKIARVFNMKPDSIFYDDFS